MATTVAGRLLDLLAAAGVRMAFGLPGVHNLALWRAQGPGRPRIVGVRHEQTTVYAADGLARATGRLGVAFVTTGPGAANAVGAFGEAARSRSPVLLLASEIPTTLARPGVVRGVLHESADQAGMFRPLAKAVFTPRSPEDVLAAVHAAIGAALTSPRGPVYVDVPTDLLGAVPTDPDVGLFNPSGPVETLISPTHAPDLTDLVELLTGATRVVVVWAGGGVIEAGAGEELGRLAERLGAPVVTSWAGRGVLPPEHPWLVGAPPHEPAVARLIADADVLLALGTRFDGMTTRNWTMPRPPRVAVVNLDAEALHLNYRPDVAVHGNLAEVLPRLRAALPEGSAAGAPGDVAAVRAEVTAGLAADPDAAAPQALLAAVRAAIDADTVVIADMCLPGYWWVGYGAVAGPRRLQYPMGWGTLGYALPAAVGAAHAGPVLVLAGDGGLAMATGELATLAQERLPVTVLVVDDGGYGMLRYDYLRSDPPGTEGDAGDSRGVDLLGPDWGLLGAAYGIPTTVLDRLDDRLGPALAAALAARAPRLVVVRAHLTPPRTTSPRWRD